MVLVVQCVDIHLVRMIVLTDGVTCPYCRSKNTATMITPPFRTFCLDCKKEIKIESKIAKIFKSMEDWKY